MQVFDKANPNNMLMHYQKNVRPDGSSLSKVYNYMTGKTQTFAVQKLEENNGFMSVLFKNFQNPVKEGEFIHCLSGKVQQRGPVSFHPVSKKVVPKNFTDNKLYLKTNIFNSKFGPIL